MMSRLPYPVEKPMTKPAPKKGTFEALECELRSYQEIQIDEHGKKVLNRNRELYEKLLINYAVLYRRIFAPQISESTVAKLVVKILLDLEE